MGIANSSIVLKRFLLIGYQYANNEYHSRERVAGASVAGAVIFNHLFLVRIKIK